MNATFADTFFWLALVTPNDTAHQKAQAFIDELSTHLLTTTWVLMEAGDALCQPRTRKSFETLLAFIDQNPLVTVVPPLNDHFTKSLDLYKRRPDKAWSLTDCTSFVIMQERNLHQALTGDHHFEQAGFIPLLK